MISEIRTILRVKKLHADRALGEMSAAKDAVEAARIVLDRARASEERSRNTLRAREDAIYEPILSNVVDRARIEKATEDVVALIDSHQHLVDRVARAEHVLEQRRAELEQAREAYQAALRAVDKYDLLLEDVRAAADLEAEAREESEVEELACRGPGVMLGEAMR